MSAVQKGAKEEKNPAEGSKVSQTGQDGQHLFS